MKFDKKRFFITILIVLIPAFFISSKKVEATPYTVLINGGYNKENNNIAFWNDLCGENRVIMTATDYDKFAYYWVNDYSEYNHELTNALSGSGDTNGDGYVSMLEAYNYVLANDDFALGYDSDGDDTPDTWEYPQYDNPSGIGRYLTLTGIIPVNQPQCYF